MDFVIEQLSVNTESERTGVNHVSLQRNSTDYEERLATLDAKEEKLADMLKNGSRDELERDAGILKEMGEVYCERGLSTKDVDNFLKSSALANAAMLRTNNPALMEALGNQLRQAEMAFCKVLSVSPTKLPVDFRSDIKQKLSKLRNEFSERASDLLKEMQSRYNLESIDSERILTEKEFTAKIKHLFVDLTAEIVDLVRHLLTESEQILGAPPQEYAAIGLGSLARGDTTPFSDIEWAILVEDESNGKDYFRNLARLVHLFVLNIQETLLKSLAIKSLNDYDKPGANWFTDSVAPRGFQFDSAAPYACNTPLGRPDRPTKEGRELIRTPQRMAQLCEYNTALKEGYNIDRIMTSVVKIGGSSGADKLVDDFISARREVKSNENVKAKAFDEILELIQDFFPKTNFHKYANTVHDIKQGLFRLPSLIICLFKTLYSLNSNSTWAVLEEMGRAGILTDQAVHNLDCVVSIVSLLRLSIYSTKHYQEESMSLLSPSSKSSEVDSRPVVYLENRSLVFRYYYTMLPLIISLQAKDAYAVFISNKIPGSFYDSNELVTGLIELNLCLYKKAREHFVSHIEKRFRNVDDETIVKKLLFDDREIFYIETDEKTRQCLFNIATTYFNEGQLHQALSYSLTLKDILERTLVEPSDGLVAQNLDQVASYYLTLGELDTALELFTKAYHQRLRMHGNESHRDLAVSLYYIGAVYSKMGKADEALRCQMEALNIVEWVHDGASHPDVLDGLIGIGETLAHMGENEQSLEWHLKALDMAKTLHGNGDHPVVAASMNNAAAVYSRLGDLKTALMYHRHSLDMDKRLLNGRDHKGTAEVLSNIGNLYRKIGDYKKALTYLNESLDMFKRILSSCNSSDDHPGIVAVLINIGCVHKEKEEYEAALLVFKEALAMMERCMKGADHPYIALTYFNIGEMLIAMERLDEALKNHKNSLFMKKRLRKNDSDIVMSLFKVAELCMETKRFDEAFLYNQEFLNMKRKLIGSRDDEDFASCLSYLAIIYRQFQQYDKAIELHLEALNMRKKLFGGKDHPKMVVTLHNIAIAYTDAGDKKSGARYRQECLDMEQRLDKSSGQASD